MLAKEAEALDPAALSFEFDRVLFLPSACSLLPDAVGALSGGGRGNCGLAADRVNAGYLHLGLSGEAMLGSGARASSVSCLEVASLRLDTEVCDVLTTNDCKVRSKRSESLFSSSGEVAEIVPARVKFPRSPESVKMGKASALSVEPDAEDRAAGLGLAPDAEEALKMV